MSKTSPVPHNESVSYRSLGLNTLISELSGDTISILDLGQACAANVEFWSRYNCRIHIEDFFAAYMKLSEGGSGRLTDELVERLLPFEDGTIFDVILAWDLFNYFDIPDVTRVVRRLGRLCHHGTLLFALISFQPKIPAVPMRFKILDPEHLVYETNSPEVRPCPRHQPRDMTILMSQFTRCKSYLLRHGIQEYVFPFSVS